MYSGFYVINTSQRIRGVLLSAASIDASRVRCIMKWRPKAALRVRVRPPADVGTCVLMT